MKTLQRLTRILRVVATTRALLYDAIDQRVITLMQCHGRPQTGRPWSTENAQLNSSFHNSQLFCSPGASAVPCLQFLRHRTTKHWNPKFKKLRREKVIKVDFPDPNHDPDKMTPEEIRTEMKTRGLIKPRPWSERPIYISCTGAIFEPYVPPEGDGKFSIISKEGVKQKSEFVMKKGRTKLAVKKMRDYDEDLNLKEFADEARDIYIKAHETLALNKPELLRQYVTERALPEMIHNVQGKTIRWKFIQSLEPGRVVHGRCTDVITKENVFAQLTVRFHTQQVLAIYDRFGRLLHGSEIVKKDVIEYIVFEKHISNQYGTWRLHDKIIPEWMPPKEPGAKTFVANKVEPVENKVETVVADNATQTQSQVQATA